MSLVPPPQKLDGSHIARHWCSLPALSGMGKSFDEQAKALKELGFRQRKEKLGNGDVGYYHTDYPDYGFFRDSNENNIFRVQTYVVKAQEFLQAAREAAERRAEAEAEEAAEKTKGKGKKGRKQ
jgi:hypothetical protein